MEAKYTTQELNDNVEQFKKKIEEYEGLASKFLGLLNALLDEFKSDTEKDIRVTVAQSELLKTCSDNYQYYSKNSAKFRQEYNGYMLDNLKKNS